MKETFKITLDMALAKQVFNNIMCIQKVTLKKTSSMDLEQYLLAYKNKPVIGKKAFYKDMVL